MRIPRLHIYFLLFTSLLINSSPVLAHKIKLFATVENMNIQGYAYFAGGQVAKQATISIQNANGETLSTLQTDAKGQFQYLAPQAMEYHLNVNTHDGHIDSYIIKATEFSTNSPLSNVLAPSFSEVTTSNNKVATVVATNFNQEDLKQIEKIISAQVHPLREQLEAYQEKIQLRDIIGGIGYIVGLAGFWLFWQMRCQNRKKDEQSEFERYLN